MALGQRAAGEREPDVDGRVDDGLVPLGQLVVGQAGAAARAVRRDPVVLDEQAAVEDLLERPPDGLDVVGVHGPVGGGHVHPVAHPLGHRLERVDVPLDGLAAAGVELGDAVRLDVALAGEAELLLDGQLHRQAVAVPAGLAGDVVALHGLEAREDVLEDAGLDVVGPGHAVGGRRALVEDPAGPAGGLLQRAGERVALAPQGEHLALQPRQVDLRGHGAVRAGGAGLGGAAHAVGPLPWRRCVTEGRRAPVVGPAPRYHPPWRGGRWPVRARSSRLLPGLLGSAGADPFFRRLRGDGGSAHTPGLAPSPGR